MNYPWAKTKPQSFHPKKPHCTLSLSKTKNSKADHNNSWSNFKVYETKSGLESQHKMAFIIRSHKEYHLITWLLTRLNKPPFYQFKPHDEFKFKPQIAFLNVNVFQLFIALCFSLAFRYKVQMSLL